MIGPDHSARAIWVLAGKLDLSAFESEVQSVEDQAGRPGWPPQLLVRVWVYGYSLGISSARALERMMEYEPGLRWLCAGEIVNHHTLSDFRVSQKKALQNLFAQVLAVLEQEGLVELRTVMQDGTKMRAVAGKQSFRGKQTIEERLAKAKELVKEMDEREKQPPGEGEDKRRQAALEGAARQRVERMEAAMKEMDARQKAGEEKKRDQLRVSISEPEARKMKHPDGGWARSYNVQVSTEAKSRVMVAVEVTQDANDQRQLEPALKRVEENTGGKLKRLIADNGYASRSNVEAAHVRKITFIAPWKEDKSREAGTIATNGLDPNFAPSAFREKPGERALVCPAGKTLLPNKTAIHHGLQRQIYEATAHDCSSCESKARCCGPNSAARQIRKVVESDGMQAYLERMKEPETQELYGRRSEVAEFPHLWTKAIRGLQRFRVRGLVKVAKEAIWMAVAYNVQQLIRLRPVTPA